MSSLPSYIELKTRLSMTDAQTVFIEQSRQTICNILNGIDHRLLLIVGPCSIHDLTSAKEFALRLSALSKALSDHFFIVMRTYFEKPRTITGWKGFLYDPYLDGSNQLKIGLEWTRQFLLDLADLHIPAATEFLDPLTALYYEDLISWGSIGARTAASQPHRQMASGMTMPIGIKNDTAGNILSAVQGVICASQPHTYIGLNLLSQPSAVHTKGNPNTHVVLRGGDNGPNYDSTSVYTALHYLQQHQLSQRLIIDCSHQNSGKCYDKQSSVFNSSMEQLISGNKGIRGLMLESHLHAGSQALTKEVSKLKYGISITDGCLDWQQTETLIFNQATRLLNAKKENFINSLSCAIAY